jgi:folate-dependent phosphoribosylglycinamide formyltransferase PurN
MLIVHEGALLSQQALPRWLASFSTVTGIVVLRETSDRLRARVRREARRIGWFRLVDVVLFRIYYRMFLRKKDLEWQAQRLGQLLAQFPAPTEPVPVLHSSSPNTEEVRHFIRENRPDILIARCKVLLKEAVFSIPTVGTFVMHPGICPEYRNSHGCFWALANRDLGKVGMTLLRIDEGVDTGPIFGYFEAHYDELRESHVVIQERVVFDNLQAIGARLVEIAEGKAEPLDKRGRSSAVWGQPWLSRYLSWKRAARRRRR